MYIGATDDGYNGFELSSLPLSSYLTMKNTIHVLLVGDLVMKDTSIMKVSSLKFREWVLE